MLPGVKVLDVKRHFDERGSFAELFRSDWRLFPSGHALQQVNLSVSHPGIVRAWHRHSRGQVDSLLVLTGSLKLCVYDDTDESKTRYELDEFTLGSEGQQMVIFPGRYWHGVKALGSGQTLSLYLLNSLYDYESPDEERRPWDDSTVVPTSINSRKDDPRTGKPWNWNLPPHK